MHFFSTRLMKVLNSIGPKATLVGSNHKSSPVMIPHLQLPCLLESKTRIPLPHPIKHIEKSPSSGIQVQVRGAGSWCSPDSGPEATAHPSCCLCPTITTYLLTGPEYMVAPAPVKTSSSQGWGQGCCNCFMDELGLGQPCALCSRSGPTG